MSMREVYKLVFVFCKLGVSYTLERVNHVVLISSLAR